MNSDCYDESDLSDRQRHAGDGDGNKRRAGQAGHGGRPRCQHFYRHEKRQGVHRQRKD
jgi:hypothetical protein